MRKAFLVSNVLVSAALTGCVSVPKVEMDQSAAGSIKTIALVSITEPKSEVVMNNNPGMALFGALGGLVQGSIDASHGSTYTKMVAANHVEFSPALAKAVSDELAKDGYAVSYLSDQHVQLASDGKSDDYSSIHTDADAILTVWFTAVGYYSPPSQSAYEPWVGIKARLVDAKTKKELYFKTFFGGFKPPSDSIVYVPSDSQYEFPSFDALQSGFDKSIAGLNTTAAAIAGSISKDMAHGA